MLYENLNNEYKILKNDSRMWIRLVSILGEHSVMSI